ncbi:hypothetical protein ACGFX4_36110 [Kitasatospora sp. NPDC048365]|uniref:hypothetical protein n=1 Tax=Kitasatospora sp. NPDC048365 TaxID=3364050 RepID=UPI00371BA753
MIGRVRTIDVRAGRVHVVPDDGPPDVLRIRPSERAKLSSFMVGRRIAFDIEHDEHGEVMSNVRFLDRPMPPNFPRPAPRD